MDSLFNQTSERINCISTLILDNKNIVMVYHLKNKTYYNYNLWINNDNVKV